MYPFIIFSASLVLVGISVALGLLWRPAGKKGTTIIRTMIVALAAYITALITFQIIWVLAFDEVDIPGYLFPLIITVFLASTLVITAGGVLTVADHLRKSK